MAKVVVKGKDRLLEGFGFNFRHREVEFTKPELSKVQEVITILERAGDMWNRLHPDLDPTGDNPFVPAEMELRNLIS